MDGYALPLETYKATLTRMYRETLEVRVTKGKILQAVPSKSC